MNINLYQSETGNVLCCIPQGSIIGPLLCLIVINDLRLFIWESIRSVNLYSDDTTLDDIGLYKDMFENNLQASMNFLKIWCLKNGLIMSVDNTKLILIIS